ncbi:uncharacterized protein LOC141905830 isoform X2 [Tubulanus polymorphus]|uniref:uncharacterized protein LOC141905830 isoform X2 n=1 Tax=Tubulanus polymorphus TaxID=672921 RepID=UPI003DA4C962
MNSNDSVNYKQKYKNLKRKLKFLIHEQECFAEELRKVQRKLLCVARDRSFLLDRLLQYEKIDESSSDSDATDSSDSDGETRTNRLFPKKQKENAFPQFPNSSDLNLLENLNYGPVSEQGQQLNCGLNIGSGNIPGPPPRKRIKKETKKPVKIIEKKTAEPAGNAPGILGPLTKEEIERHLDAKQSSFMIERAPATMPSDIFNNDNSNFDIDEVSSDALASNGQEIPSSQ